MFSRRKREPAPPDLDAVVDRVLCVGAIAMLGTVAAGVEDGSLDEETAAKYLAESHRWLIREKLASALSSQERALLAKTLGEWTEEERLAAGWRSEAMGVLLWAISAIDDLPPYDARFEQLPSFVPLLAPTAGFRGAARLRSPEVIGAARGVAELWHWRARTRQLQERGDAEAAGADLEAIAHRAALAHAGGSPAPPIDGDFPAYGKPFRALDAGERAAVTSSAAERHYALNWLAGYAADWDGVPTAT